jgi:thymidylate kinase
MHGKDMQVVHDAELCIPQELISPYELVITGTVAAGKTTICNYLREIFRKKGIDYYFYEEFADTPLGSDILRARLLGYASVYTLQHYAIDHWEYLKKPAKSNIVHLYDRIPDDTVLCFCNIWNMQGLLDTQSLASMWERVGRLHGYHPYYDSPMLEFLEVENSDFDNSITTILQIMNDDIARGDVRTRVIGLSITPAQSRERIIARNRLGESNYTDEDLSMFARYIHQLYKYLQGPRKCPLRLLDMGKML